MSQRENFGTVLVGEGLLTLEQLQQARELQAETGEALTRVLVEEGMVDEPKLVRTLAGHMGVEYISLGDLTVDPQRRRQVPEANPEHEPDNAGDDGDDDRFGQHSLPTNRRHRARP